METRLPLPEDTIIFNDVLCNKFRNRFMKRHVQLKKTFKRTPSGVEKVFELEIGKQSGKSLLQLQFMEQDLCFLRFEELREEIEQSNCMACIDRRNSPFLIYCRLLLIFCPLISEDKEASRQCTTVPLLQKGNIYGITTLRKLKKVLQEQVISQGEMKMWDMQVVRCSSLREGTYVSLAVTKFALVIVHQYSILCYHMFLTCQFSVRCVPMEHTVELTVRDKTWVNDTHETQNFALYRTYVFKCNQCSEFEKDLMSHQRLSQANPQIPRAHFNIQHSELSNSGIIQASTSDNLMHHQPLLPHDLENNNTDSSSSNSFSGKLNVMVHPQSHGMGGGTSTSSNGQLPNLCVARDNSEIKVNNVDSQAQSMENSKQIQRPSTLGLQTRGIEARENVNDTKYVLSDIKDSSGPSPCIITGNTDPTGTFGHHNILRTPSASELEGETAVKTVYNSKEENLPPPPAPCSNVSIPFGTFAYKPPVPTPSVPLGKKFIHVPERKPIKKLLRSQSFCQMLDNELTSHLYVNVEQELFERKSAYNDTPYYRFYYNVGFMLATRMSKKLRRRSRMSQEINNVDFNKLENHETWYDRCFKERSKDLRFCRLSGMNIDEPPPPSEDSSNPTAAYSDIPEDPYWNGELSITIQMILQKRLDETGLAQQIQQCFDVSYEQLASMEVYLSLVQAEKNWKDMAEYIGLDISQISIIEHFSYTYRELTAKVVFAHWIRMYNSGKLSTRCCRENLELILEELDRQDVLNVLRTTNVNSHVHKVTEVTHF